MKYLTVTDYSLHPDIYTIGEYYKDGQKWYAINGDTHYRASEWSIKEAVADYLTEEAKAERDEAFRRANGFYD